MLSKMLQHATDRQAFGLFSLREKQPQSPPSVTFR